LMMNSANVVLFVSASTPAQYMQETAKDLN